MIIHKVTRWFRGHESLMLRAYLLMVAGLLLAAVLLDFGFRVFGGDPVSPNETWLRASVQLVESELSAAPDSERSQVVDRLQAATGLTISVMHADAVSRSAVINSDLETLVDENGRQHILYYAPTIESVIRIGPVMPESRPVFARLLPVLFYLSIFVVVGLWLQPLLKDIRDMTDAAHRFAADYRQPLSTAKSTTRLTSLAHNLDSMSARLSGMIQTQKELIAALSHEMRTPLTRIRFGLATLDKNDAQAHAEQVDALNDDVQDIDRLIGTMLNYARLDHPDLRMNWQDIPLSSWLQDTTHKVACKDVTLTVEPGDAPSTLAMDPRLMALALSNMLTNAVRHAHSRVSCRVELSNNQARLIVEDDGPGIPSEQRDKALKAFSRLDDSRNRETGGCGLGLAIVARIANLHRGQVLIETSKRLGGAQISVVWGVPESLTYDASVAHPATRVTFT